MTNLTKVLFIVISLGASSTYAMADEFIDNDNREYIEDNSETNNDNRVIDESVTVTNDNRTYINDYSVTNNDNRTYRR